MTYVKPRVYNGFGPAKKQVWNELASLERKKVSASLCVNQTGLAEKLGYCRKTIQNALKTFISANLLKRVEHNEGRGNHNRYKFLWNFRKLRLKKESNQRKKQQEFTKGSPPQYKWMKRFRTFVEDTHFGRRSDLICGEIFNLLEGETVSAVKRMYNRLRERMKTDWRIGDFYAWLHDFREAVLDHSNNHSRSPSGNLDSTASNFSDEFNAGYDEELPECSMDHVNRDTDDDDDGNGPPRMKDYDTMAEYLEAVDEWDEESNGGEDDDTGVG